MHRAVDDLTGILEKQIENHLTLKDLMLEKRKAIIANDLKRLSETTSQINTLIASNNRLEIGRIGLVKKLGAALKLPEPKPTLVQIARCFEGPLSEKLMELRRRASAAIKEVQRQNRMNAEMLKYCADLMDSVMRRLVDTDSQELTYGSTGRARKQVASAALLDQHV